MSIVPQDCFKDAADRLQQITMRQIGIPAPTACSERHVHSSCALVQVARFFGVERETRLT